MCERHKVCWFAWSVNIWAPLLVWQPSLLSVFRLCVLVAGQLPHEPFCSQKAARRRFICERT
jgi:hypothetical protein